MFLGTLTRTSLDDLITRSSSLACALWATTCPWLRKGSQTQSLSLFLTLWIPTGTWLGPFVFILQNILLVPFGRSAGRSLTGWGLCFLLLRRGCGYFNNKLCKTVSMKVRLTLVRKKFPLESDLVLRLSFLPEELKPLRRVRERRALGVEGQQSSRCFSPAGMDTSRCRSTWRSWSAGKQRTWNPARRSRALSVPSAPRGSPTWPRRSSTR